MRIQCFTCDKQTDVLDEHGMCNACTTEFQQIRLTRFHGCDLCITPISCVMAKACLKSSQCNSEKCGKV